MEDAAPLTVEPRDAGPAARRSRRDRDEVRLTPRDLTCLTWIGEQYAVRFDHLQQLLARSAGKQPLDASRLGASTTGDLLARWRRVGLVETHKVLATAPSWTWLSRQGLRHCGLVCASCSPAAASLAHLHAINAVRLLIEGRPGTEGWSWQSERLLRAQLPPAARGTRRQHLPDGVVQLHDERPEAQVAIEVELSLKARDRLEGTIATLLEHYASVWYFVAPEVERALVRAVACREPTQRKRVRVYTMSGVDVLR